MHINVIRSITIHVSNPENYELDNNIGLFNYFYHINIKNCELDNNIGLFDYFCHINLFHSPPLGVLRVHLNGIGSVNICYYDFDNYSRRWWSWGNVLASRSKVRGFKSG